MQVYLDVQELGADVTVIGGRWTFSLIDPSKCTCCVSVKESGHIVRLHLMVNQHPQHILLFSAS